MERLINLSQKWITNKFFFNTHKTKDFHKHECHDDIFKKFFLRKLLFLYYTEI